MACRRDAGSAVDIGPDVTLVGQVGRACMNPHPDPNLIGGQTLACLRRRDDCVRGRWERDKERVALGVNLDSVVGGVGVAHDAPMLGQSLRVTLGSELVSRCVEPSTSVNRKVTVPEGRPGCTAG